MRALVRHVALLTILSFFGSLRADTIEKFLGPEQKGRQAVWIKRADVALSAEEREEIVSLGKLPFEESFRRIGWFIVNCGPQVREVARQTLLTVPNWEASVRQRLDDPGSDFSTWTKQWRKWWSTNAAHFGADPKWRPQSLRSASKIRSQ
jgi:hypothetical protein